MPEERHALIVVRISGCRFLTSRMKGLMALPMTRNHRCIRWRSLLMHFVRLPCGC